MSRQWIRTSEEEKNIWKFRAEQMDPEPSPLREASDCEEGDDPNDGKKRDSLKKPPRKSGHSAEV
jgi:hypothetical protein